MASPADGLEKEPLDHGSGVSAGHESVQPEHVIGPQQTEGDAQARSEHQVAQVLFEAAATRVPCLLDVFGQHRRHH